MLVGIFSASQNEDLCDPLPLVEKGKYQEAQPPPKLVLLKQSTADASEIERLLANKNTRNLSQIHQPLQQLKVKKGSDGAASHTCVCDSERMRCQVCSSVMKFSYHAGELPAEPLSLSYVDYVPVFLKKMELVECQKHLKKGFIKYDSLTKLRDWVFYVLDRPRLQGLEDLVQSDQQKVPRMLSGYENYSKQRNFGPVKILGDFEGSNIGMCNIVRQNKINILVRSDTNTKGCLHWFSFIVLANEPCTIQFSVLNNKRNGQLYKDAVLDSHRSDRGWHRGCDSIYYYRSNVDHNYYKVDLSAPVLEQTAAAGADNDPLAAKGAPSLAEQQMRQEDAANKKKPYQTLDFTYQFTEKDQRVHFAYSYPYTFTDLMHFLEEQEEVLLRSLVEKQHLDKEKRQLRITTNNIQYKRKQLGSTRLGLPLYLLKITANSRSAPLKKHKRKAVFIIARQHPGETPSSYVCSGLLRFLLGGSEQAKFLRELHYFYVIPMMNPDGVVVGNSRCSISGFDLNRKWQNPDKLLCPEVFVAKSVIAKTNRKRGIAVFTDLHGHSQLRNSFIYGCSKVVQGDGTSLAQWTQARLLPRILAQKSPCFKFEECRFRVTEDKMSTARVVVWNELKVANSFTLETSFFGYDDVVTVDGSTTSILRSFTTQDLEDLGKSLALSILEYSVLSLEQLTADIQEIPSSPHKHEKSISKNTTKNSDQNGSIYSAATPQSSSVATTAPSSSQSSVAATKSTASTTTAATSNALLRSAKRSDSGNFPPAMQQYVLQNASAQSGGGNGTTKAAPNLSSDYFKVDLIGTTVARAPNRMRSNNELANLQSASPKKKTLTNQQGKISRDFLSLLCPNIRSDWRDYFDREELVKNIQIIEMGGDPNDREKGSGGDSDSEPEADLLAVPQHTMYPMRKSKKCVKKNDDLPKKKIQQVPPPPVAVAERSPREANKPPANTAPREKPIWKLTSNSHTNTGSGAQQAASSQLSSKPASGSNNNNNNSNNDTAASAHSYSPSKNQLQSGTVRSDASPGLQSHSHQTSVRAQTLKKQHYPIHRVGHTFGNALPSNLQQQGVINRKDIVAKLQAAAAGTGSIASAMCEDSKSHYNRSDIVAEREGRLSMTVKEDRSFLPLQNEHSQTYDNTVMSSDEQDMLLAQAKNVQIQSHNRSRRRLAASLHAQQEVNGVGVGQGTHNIQAADPLGAASASNNNNYNASNSSKFQVHVCNYPITSSGPNFLQQSDLRILQSGAQLQHYNMLQSHNILQENLHQNSQKRCQAVSSGSIKNEAEQQQQNIDSAAQQLTSSDLINMEAAEKREQIMRVFNICFPFSKLLSIEEAQRQIQACAAQNNREKSAGSKGIVTLKQQDLYSTLVAYQQQQQQQQQLLIASQALHQQQQQHQQHPQRRLTNNTSSRSDMHNHSQQQQQQQQQQQDNAAMMGCGKTVGSVKRVSECASTNLVVIDNPFPSFAGRQQQFYTNMNISQQAQLNAVTESRLARQGLKTVSESNSNNNNNNGSSGQHFANAFAESQILSHSPEMATAKKNRTHQNIASLNKNTAAAAYLNLSYGQLAALNRTHANNRLSEKQTELQQQLENLQLLGTEGSLFKQVVGGVASDPFVELKQFLKGGTIPAQQVQQPENIVTESSLMRTRPSRDVVRGTECGNSNLSALFTASQSSQGIGGSLAIARTKRSNTNDTPQSAGFNNTQSNNNRSAFPNLESLNYDSGTGAGAGGDDGLGKKHHLRQNSIRAEDRQRDIYSRVVIDAAAATTSSGGRRQAVRTNAKTRASVMQQNQSQKNEKQAFQEWRQAIFAQHEQTLSANSQTINSEPRCKNVGGAE